MTVHQLKRVMQRMRHNNPGKEKVRRDELLRAILIEAGHSPRTYYNYQYALLKIGWLTRHKHWFRLTGKDLVEDYG
jgi:hypothetical protein